MKEVPEEIRKILLENSPEDIEIVLIYKNWRGEVSERRIIPLEIYHGEVKYHKGKQWLIKVYDLDKEDYRDYSLMDILEWKHIPKPL